MRVCVTEGTTSLCLVVVFHSTDTLRIAIGVTSALLILAILLTSVLVFLCVHTRHKTTPAANNSQFKLAFGTPRRKPPSTAANNLAQGDGQEQWLPMVSSPHHTQGPAMYENV